MKSNILVLPGDGIGPEIMREAIRVLETLIKALKLPLVLSFGDIGGAAIDRCGSPLDDETLRVAEAADAILLGAVGGPQWDHLDPAIRPEKGLLKIRSALGLFANIRPAILYPQLAEASTLKPEVVSGLDMVIVRELTGGLYFGQPRGIREVDGEREGFNTLPYRESEIARIAKVAFELAQHRNKRLCSVDKANVLESSQVWRDTVNLLSKNYPDVELTHMYVDNAAMQLVKCPKQFDVIVTDNLFGDILSDEAAMLTGSIGMLPSASLDAHQKGMYEPCHGSAPDIAGKNMANPLATILSVAMMLRYTFLEHQAADLIHQCIEDVLDQGIRTSDIAHNSMSSVPTSAMGDAVLGALNKRML